MASPQSTWFLAPNRDERLRLYRNGSMAKRSSGEYYGFVKRVKTPDSYSINALQGHVVQVSFHDNSNIISIVKYKNDKNSKK